MRFARGLVMSLSMVRLDPFLRLTHHRQFGCSPVALLWRETAISVQEAQMLLCYERHVHCHEDVLFSLGQLCQLHARAPMSLGHAM
jgi:hypothetical protein